MPAPPAIPVLDDIREMQLAMAAGSPTRALHLWIMRQARTHLSRAVDRETGQYTGKIDYATTRLNEFLPGILAAGANPDEIFNNTTALCVCAMKGNTDAMQILISSGASLGLVASSTALMSALAHSRTAAALLALDHGADPNQPNAAGDTPAQAALQNGEIDLLGRLFAKGASINPADPSRPHPAAVVLGLWEDEHASSNTRSYILEKTIKLAGCNLDVDAACSGQSVPCAMGLTMPDEAPRLLAMARQAYMARCVPPASAPSATPRRV